MRLCGSDAPWSSDPLSHWDCLNRVLNRGESVSPLLSGRAPWVTTKIFRKDWLHASDQGVAADFIGNLFRLLQTKFPGGNVKARTAALFLDIEQFYDRNRTHDRLQTLVPKMIKQDRKAPKLRCSAAECRALVP